MKKLFQLSSFFSFLTAAFNAEAYEGMAQPWQMNFQKPVTPVMEALYNLHSMLLILITVITIFVLIIMAYIVVRFRRKANPVPSKTTHHTMLEIIWTTIPILILVVIAIPSLRLHYFMQRPVDTELTVKVVGYQWYWHYEYPDNGGFGFDSYIKKGKDLGPDDHRQLSVDNRLVVPVDTKVRVQITGADVIHSFAVPAFGIKKDAVPGRLNETWFEANQIGTFYGQCSQLCGVGHGFMPIVVDVVSKDDYAAWVARKKLEAGIAATSPAEKGAPPPKGAVPLAKPESAKDKNPDARTNEEKKNSQKKGEGKPAIGKVVPNKEDDAATSDTDKEDKE